MLDIRIDFELNNGVYMDFETEDPNIPGHMVRHTRLREPFRNNSYDHFTNIWQQLEQQKEAITRISVDYDSGCLVVWGKHLDDALDYTVVANFIAEILLLGGGSAAISAEITFYTRDTFYVDHDSSLAPQYDHEEKLLFENLIDSGFHEAAKQILRHNIDQIRTSLQERSEQYTIEDTPSGAQVTYNQ